MAPWGGRAGGRRDRGVAGRTGGCLVAPCLVHVQTRWPQAARGTPRTAHTPQELTPAGRGQRGRPGEGYGSFSCDHSPCQGSPCTPSWPSDDGSRRVLGTPQVGETQGQHVWALGSDELIQVSLVSHSSSWILTSPEAAQGSAGSCQLCLWPGDEAISPCSPEQCGAELGDPAVLPPVGTV